MTSDPHLSVIALHGIALTDEEIAQTEGPVLEHAGAPNIRWLFPRAPRRKVTIMGGCSARAWFDTSTYDRSLMDEAGIEEATEAICAAVRMERDRDQNFLRRVVLMGFSQGGALALHAGLRLQAEVDGIIALATALPFPDRLCAATSQSPPVFFGHGFLDPCVSYQLGRESQQLLAAKRYQTEWHTYAYGHSTGRRQLRDVSGWLSRHFLNAAPAPAKPMRVAAPFPLPRVA
jgi:phospholipase/carboxylesterase